PPSARRYFRSSRLRPRAVLCSSTSMDISQYYIPGRVAAAADVFANVLGTALGAMIGSVAYRYVSWLFFRETRQTGSPLLLVGLWLGYRLFPHVPTIDLHKYWDALKPVVLHPSL